MPPDGYHAITVDEETMNLLTQVMVEYDCDSVAQAAKRSATVALESDDAALAQLLADRLSE